MALAGIAMVAGTGSEAFGGDFLQTAGPSAGRIDSLALRGGTAWTATPGGFFRSDDGGQTWVRAGDTPAVTLWREIVVTDPALLAVSWNYSVYRSSDDGQTWAEVDFAAGDQNHVQLVARGNALFALLDLATDVLLTSDDGGATWTPLTLPAANVGDLLVNDNVMVVTEDLLGLHRSTDGGQTWSEVSADLPQDLIRRHSVGASAMIVQGMFLGQLFRSDDDGVSWKQIDPPFAGGNFDIPLGLSDGSATLYAAYSENDELALYRSVDDGQTWQLLSTSGLPPQFIGSSAALPFAADGTDVLLSFPFTSAGVYRSTDGGGSWNASSLGIIATTIHKLGIAGNTILASGAMTDTNFQSPDDGDTWQVMPGLPELISYVAVDIDTVIAGSRRSGAFRSDDAGLSWTSASSGLPDYNSTSGGAIQPLNELVTHNGFVFAATGGGAQFIGDNHCGCTSTPSGDGVYRTSNQGASWQRVSNGLPINQFHLGEPILRPITALQSIGVALLAATPEHGVHRSTNDGGSWSPTSGAPGGTDFTVFNGDVYLANGTNTLRRSTNAGQSWSVIATNLPVEFNFARLHVHDGVLYAIAGSTQFAPSTGMYQSTDAADWQPASSTLSDIVVSDLATHGDDLVAATVGRGVWIDDGGPDDLPADINGDGVVDVFDLIDLLAAWGACDPPCPPSCPADIVNDDCAVNVFDLLELLSSWSS